MTEDYVETVKNVLAELGVPPNIKFHARGSLGLLRAPIDNRYTFKYSEGITLVK